MSGANKLALLALSYSEHMALRCRHLRADPSAEPGGTVAVFNGTVQLDHSVPRVAHLCPFCLGIVHTLMRNMGEATADTD